jgi:hypothetical protein
MKIIFLINFLIRISVTLKQNEICKNIQQECKGKYNLFNTYIIDCNQVKCHGNHPFKCNHIYCTKNAKSCIDFYNLNRPSASMLKLPQRTNKHSMYESKIKDCNLKQYKLKKDNVCKNEKNCILIKKSPKNSYSFQMTLKEKTVCPCSATKYDFHCGIEYCTSNSIVCDHLLKIKSNKTFSFFNNFPKCMNGNQTIKQLVFESF